MAGLAMFNIFFSPLIKMKWNEWHYNRKKEYKSINWKTTTQMLFPFHFKIHRTNDTPTFRLVLFWFGLFCISFSSSLSFLALDSDDSRIPATTITIITVTVSVFRDQYEYTSIFLLDQKNRRTKRNNKKTRAWLK